MARASCVAEGASSAGTEVVLGGADDGRSDDSDRDDSDRVDSDGVVSGGVDCDGVDSDAGTDDLWLGERDGVALAEVLEEAEAVAATGLAV
jgi:hypothetical protein